ncbi:MAG: RnfH family protein [Proteobacteria bacterium]|nr:RnfH family protein [Pseudomonadota bacterium]
MTIRVCVVYSARPRHNREVQLLLQGGASLRDAVQASGLLEAFPEIDLAAAGVGIWGRRAALDQPLRDRDRVEIYRPLTVDPKVARRERFRRQGARSAGLFASKGADKRDGGPGSENGG